jgi:hypothetical protein
MRAEITELKTGVDGVVVVVAGIRADVDVIKPVVDSLKCSQESFQRLEIESKKRSVHQGSEIPVR